MNIFKNMFQKIETTKIWKENSLQAILKKYPKDGKGLYRHDELVNEYNKLINNNEIKQSRIIEERIRMKPTRTLSGVATVTVLTKPYPCPGACIFCPNDRNMPKSYISSEPGAQRALKNKFDPFEQVFNRITALQNIGHNTDKIELIILGGTCSFYPEKYILWFVKRCFDAMNSFGTSSFKENDTGVNDISWEELLEVQKFNETTVCRNVGLVLETRPDYITEDEIIRFRKLGATKIQIGVQSLNDEILSLNHRGHSTKETERAFQLLRLSGFKIHAHWMPNLYGSTVKKDIKDYSKLFTKKYSPDELKIYPTSIIPNTPLAQHFKNKKYKPYTKEQLLTLFVNILPKTPKYVRLTRIIRDIPSNEILDGNKYTNFRQIAEEEIKREKKKIEDIRSREIKDRQISFNDLKLEVIKYKTTVSTEYFISYVTKDTDQICSFLRLSLPTQKSFIKEIEGNAMIREVHVYGSLVNIGRDSTGESQHLGLGTKMIDVAKGICAREGYVGLSVISAIGTKGYYRARGFEDGVLYQGMDLSVQGLEP